MREQGVVTRLVSSHIAEVAFQSSEACAKCRLCRALEEGMMGVEAENEAGARCDDTVEIEIPSKEMVKGSMVVFLIPIFFLGFGYLLGAFLMRSLGWLGWEEAVGVVFAIAALVLSFYAVRWYDQNVEEKQALRPRIVRVISSR